MDNSAIWATVIVGTTTASVTWASGYLQRKQMRQNELFRADPSVGLIPPPHPIKLFLWEHRTSVLNVAVAVYFLVRGLAGEGPVTRIAVLNIALGVAFVLVAIVLEIVRGGLVMLGKVLHIIDRMIGIQEGNLEIAEGTTTVLENTVGAPKLKE